MPVENLVSLTGDGFLEFPRVGYDIKLDQLYSHQKILEWCVHLSRKSWFSMEILRHFINLACHANGLTEIQR